MKIVDIVTKKVDFKREKVFKIAFTSNSESQGVYVKILTDEGICGLGEAAPFPLVTSETADGVIVAIEFMKSELLGEDPANIAKIHAIMDKTLLNNTSAKAAIDIACYDIMGKKEGKPVHKLIGAKADSVQTDMTIGIDTVENMVKEAVGKVAEGFRIIKIKCGIDAQKDIEVLKQIRKAVGDDIDLRIDANQGYDKETALYVLGQISKYNITEAEQPLPFWDIDGMEEINKLSPVSVMADESVHTPIQAEIVCRRDACKIVNIKLMKCGGIYPALQIADIAKKYGKTCIVGCFYESKLSISAAAAVVLARDNIESADLDSFFLFPDSEDSVCGGFKVDKDIITMSSKSGYGFDDYDF